jgi:hypothetical protein
MTTRNYDLDAYRHTKDLRDKVNSKFAYNNLMMTCYDATILWLNAIYHSLYGDNLSKLDKVNVETLVEEIAKKRCGTESQLAGYDRLYHSYYLVYKGYTLASEKDVNEAIKTLKHVLDFYLVEIPMNNLVSLYDFLITESPLDDKTKLDSKENREFIFAVLDIRNIPQVTY